MPGRNDPCPCGSGKKFKKCCLDKYAVVRPQTPKAMQLQPGVTQEKANAYHEAGHAVFAELLGPGVDIVTIDPQKVAELTGHEYPGYTLYAGPKGQKAEFMVLMCMTLAGLTSEAAYATNGMINTKENDLQLAEELLDQAGLHGQAREQEFLRSRLVTQKMVEKHQAEIEAVAKTLVERKTLTGTELRSLIASVSQKP